VLQTLPVGPSGQHGPLSDGRSTRTASAATRAGFNSGPPPRARAGCCTGKTRRARALVAQRRDTSDVTGPDCGRARSCPQQHAAPRARKGASQTSRCARAGCLPGPDEWELGVHVCRAQAEAVLRQWLQTLSTRPCERAAWGAEASAGRGCRQQLLVTVGSTTAAVPRRLRLVASYVWVVVPCLHCP